MIPILLSGETVKGFLADAMTCVVTEERNGVYELTLTYPVAGALFAELAVDRLIKAKPNDTFDLQLFRIYEITKPINGVVTVNAEHVSYALSHFPVNNISVTGNAALVINTILSNANGNLAASHDFSVATTGLSASKKFEYAVGSVRSALGGSDGSVLDVFGGEYEFDNYVIRLHRNRGSDTGVIVAYGKNLTDIEVDTSMENSYTHLFPERNGSVRAIFQRNEKPHSGRRFHRCTVHIANKMFCVPQTGFSFKVMTFIGKVSPHPTSLTLGHLSRLPARSALLLTKRRPPDARAPKGRRIYPVPCAGKQPPGDERLFFIGYIVDSFESNG